jgi:hypothetical protein
MKIISGILIIITAFLSFKHAWDGLVANKPESAQMMAGLGITKTMGIALGILSIAVGIMVLLPKTYFAGCLINALVILVIMALALRAGNLKIALIEIPFLLIPLLMMWLGHPFKDIR